MLLEITDRSLLNFSYSYRQQTSIESKVLYSSTSALHLSGNYPPSLPQRAKTISSGLSALA